MMPVEKSKDYQNKFGLSRAAIFNAVEASLRRLDTPYIDVLQIHRFDTLVPIEETLQALDDLIRSGKVRYIGASSMWACQFARLQVMTEAYGRVTEEEREMIRYCNETGVGLIPWSPLCNGCLTRLPPSEDRVSSKREEFESKFGSTLGYVEPDLTIRARVAEIAEKKDWSMSHVALAWIQKRVSSPIVGFTKVEQIDDALDAKGKSLTIEEEAYLEILYKPKAIYGHQ
ncbi:aldo keto reductase [Colletotrichum incanum]|uniref:Aldo keto reductase n=1 Tax=Colletotrichum incanum TaxID=1573173 RepID=A0A167CIF9_COLIC|nr:aldo keto reductase [Colletotrichum incanum]